jgi:hypothetical protein
MTMEREFAPKKAQASVLRASSIIRAREINLDTAESPGNSLIFFGNNMSFSFQNVFKPRTAKVEQVKP